MAWALYRYPPTPRVMLAGTLGLSGTLALALARYEAAVALGFLLLGVVRVEPAPSDGVFFMVMAVALVTGRFDIRRVPLTAFALVGVLVALNIISAMEALDPGTAARYFSITLYLAVLSIWFTGYLNSTKRARAGGGRVHRGRRGRRVPSTLALFIPIPFGDQLLTIDGLRAEGLFKDPNVYGPFLIPPALFLLEELLTPRLLRFRTSTKALMFTALTLGVLFSYSRAAWANMAVAIGVMLAGAHPPARGRPARHRGLRVAHRRGRTRRGGDRRHRIARLPPGARGFQTYDLQRFGAQRTGIALAERYPFGIGPGQFEVFSPVSTHSTYVRVLAEQGVLGLVTVLALILFTLVLASRNAILGRDCLWDRLRRAARDLDGHRRELLCGRHPALAARLGGGGDDLGGVDAPRPDRQLAAGASSSSKSPGRRCM